MDPLSLLSSVAPLAGLFKGGGSTKVNTSTSQTSQIGVAVNPAIVIGGGSAGQTGSVSGGSPSASATGAPQMDPVSLFGGGLPSYATGGSPYPSYGSAGVAPQLTGGDMLADNLPILLIGGGLLAWYLLSGK